jgi:ribose 5-phosphate isomerase RpiB
MAIDKKNTEFNILVDVYGNGKTIEANKMVNFMIDYVVDNIDRYAAIRRYHFGYRSI